MVADFDTIVIGGGLAGLTCAQSAINSGLSCQLLEASDDVGGRVRTDKVDGYLLDRGFQVFLTAYPAAQSVLDFDELQLCRFEAGALVRFSNRFHRFADPWREPKHLLATAMSPVATFADKLRVAKFRIDTTRDELQDIYVRSEQSTIDLLRSRGFSDKIVERFFRPFLGGVMLDRNLETSSRMCEFVFRMFSLGDTTLPAQGMGEIPRQLANRLPSEVIQLNSPVNSIGGKSVILASGEQLTARSIVVATGAPAARKLLGDPSPAVGRQVTNLYFAADEPPIHDPVLVLNGTGDGPINNLCVPSQVAQTYAPTGKSLVSVTVLEEHEDQDHLLRLVKRQLATWFGSQVSSWCHIRNYVIPYALPRQFPTDLEPVAKPSRVGEHVFVCGDHCDTASINGAMASGLRAAEGVVALLRER
ncbi:NAD(P)/FAD-dependent oxidoreductase [Bythopirellula polymerisocia]|uniref:Pseudooxynicotine oxidase n=1 Tax=Bythopirellula polymerisocia TaxID=2528003 RepID=A0A5C6D324_9BACT|nr:NAD(P)/FAD-dependent oxidoreductase [Bythopirellula polymerisocia]TWU30525.1 Pseudooxynicotine oxidase [Bythopirellula polymerisocia]